MANNPFENKLLGADSNLFNNSKNESKDESNTVKIEPPVPGEDPALTKALEDDAKAVEQHKKNIESREKVKPDTEHTKNETEHAKILREHGGMESNIPFNHVYWRIRP